MPPWIIVSSSAILAIVVAAANAVPELLNAAPAEIVRVLVQQLPALAVVLLAVYALFAMLLATAGLLAGTLHARQHAAPDRRDLIFAPGANGFGRPAPRLISVLTRPRQASAGSVLEARFSPNEARSEIARLHYVALARSHFFSAMIVLAGIIGLGLAQDFATLPFSPGRIPTVSAVLVFVGLVLLTLLGRVAIDVTVEPLLEAFSEFPAERGGDADEVRRAVEALERASIAGERAPPVTVEFPERLAAVFEASGQAVTDAVNRFSERTQALETVVRSSLERLEAVMRTSVQDRSPAFDIRAFSELGSAVQELTAALRNVPAAPERAEQAIVPASPDPSRRTAPPRLAGELRRLLQEFDAG